jgi:hypothetical protein
MLARRFDRRLLHDDKPGTRQRQRTQVLEMPVVLAPTPTVELVMLNGA